MYHVDYDKVADEYDQRYQSGAPVGVIEAFHWLAQFIHAYFILEVGCGTGYWLTEIQDCEFRIGIDSSSRMLDKARNRNRSLMLVRGFAEHLPFCDRLFDFVFCVHALHHFFDPKDFIHEARRILRKSGGLAIIGIDPQMEKDLWYVYEFFPGTYETDISRCPSGNTILKWMKEAGFERIERRLAAHFDYDFKGREVLRDPILHKNGTSQLSLLTEEAFNNGMARIREALQIAETQGDELIFPTHISLPIVYGFTP